MQAFLIASNHVGFGDSFGEVHIISRDIHGMLRKVRQRIACIVGTEHFVPVVSIVVLDEELGAQHAAPDDEEPGQTKRGSIFVLAVSGMRSAVAEDASKTYDHGRTSRKKVDINGRKGDDSEGRGKRDEAEKAPPSVQKDEKILANSIQIIANTRARSTFTATSEGGVLG